MSVVRYPGVTELEVSGHRSGVEPGIVARMVTVNVGSTDLTVEQISAIFSDICDRSSLTLKVLDLSGNYYVGGVEPGLMARAVTRLETVNVRHTDLTVEQKSAIKKAASRSSCRVIV